MGNVFETLPESEKKQVVQCAHLFRSGRRCPRLAADGETICVLHGANIEHVKDAQARRLLSLQETALDVMDELMASAEDKVRAIVSVAVLDRTGMGPKSTVQVETQTPLDDKSDEELAALLKELGTQAEQNARQQRMNEDSLTKPSARNVRPH